MNNHTCSGFCTECQVIAWQHFIMLQEWQKIVDSMTDQQLLSCLKALATELRKAQAH